MNKYLYILSLAGAALLSACSNSDDLSIVEYPAVNKAKESVLIYEAGQNSEVPITLGTSHSRGYTRAPIGGESDNPNYLSFDTESGKYLGVFCLATGYQSSYHPIENNWTDEDNADLIVRMRNIPAKVKEGDVTFLDSTTLASPTPTEMKFYYPISNWMKYNFYAYYPRQAYDVDGTKTHSFGESQVLEKYFEIDGSQDIIWGMANPPGVDAAFSAKYFKDNVSAEKPQLKFEHKLVQFRFFVIATDDVPAKEMKIANMYISNAVYRLSLIVANKTNEADTKNGQLNLLGDFKTETLYIKENGKNTNRFDGTPSFDINNTSVDVSSDTPVGYIMLARPDVAYEKKADYKYKLVVRVQYKDGTKTKYKNVPRFMTPPEGGFQEGKIYNIVVKIGLDSGGVPN